MPGQRKLAAILFTDIVGSTAVTARSESAGLAARDRHRELVRPFVKAHRGRLIEAPGDESLSLFDSAVDAVQCALAIQQAVDTDDSLRLHIGVHLGETVLRGHEVFGDGINLAARICALSDGSAPYISDEVHHAVRNQTHLRFESLGDHELKNVPRAVPVYRVKGTAQPPQRLALRQRLGMRHPRRWLAAAVLILALIGLGLWSRYRSVELAPIRSLAVLPLENLSGDPEQEYFADGMTEMLIGDLGKVGSLKVISRTSVMQYKGARKPLREIAAELGVDALLEGTVMREGERVRITAQLIDGRTDHHLWAERYDRDLRGVLELQSDVARAVAREIALELTPGAVAKLAERPSVDPAAHDALLSGIYQLGRPTPESLRSAIASFERAIELDPGYALAHAELGFAWFTLTVLHRAVPSLEGMPKAKSAALRALELDPALADAHAVLGGVAYGFDWDWPASEGHFRRALELNPSLAWARTMYAFQLASRSRHEEAIAEGRQAVVFDPLDLSRRLSLAALYRATRRYDDALAEVRKVIEMDPTLPGAHLQLAWNCERLGRYEEAIAAYQRAGTLSPEEGSAFRAALSDAGPRGFWREALRIGLHLPGARHFFLASFHAQLGQRDEAFAELERAYESREGGLALLRVDARFDPIRDDPRFDALVRRIGLPES